jgi:hypothetical protein
MNPELLRQKLVAAARAAEPPSDRVPYAFEKRIMARLAGRPVTDPWSALAGFLWRAVLPCCAVMLIAGASTFAIPSPHEDLGAQLDAVLLADLDTGTETP